MKKPVLQRSMFMAVMPKSKSKGILSGIEEDDDKYESDRDDEDDFEDRRPDSLEIIANNLRGDMRSMDERYLELAQMVGEAAFETPEEVVTLMQSQFAQQPQQPIPAPAPAQQGLGALAGGPAGPTVPPPTGGIVAGMGEQPPVQMADGGLVYRQAGSPPWGEIKAALDQFESMPLNRPIGDYPAGSRRLGFMKYLEQGTLARPGEVAARSTAIPRVAVQQTGPMTGFLSAEAANYLRSGAGQARALPSRIDLATQIGTRLSEAGRNIVPFARDVGRTLMGTPQGRVAAAIGATGMAAMPFIGGEGEKSTEPNYSEVPGVDAQGRYVPVLRTSAPVPTPTGPVEMPGEKVPAPPEPGAPGGMTTLPGMKPSEERLLPEEERAGATRVTPEMYKRREEVEPEKGFRERVQEKMDLYSEFLGSDPEMRKAQALFLLAEAALNVAGATGRSTAERLSKGLKGLPAGMAQLGAEAEKDKRAIAAAALSSVEQEYADARKAAAMIQRELAKKGTGLPEKVRSLTSSILARDPNMDQRVAVQLATDMDNGTVTQDKGTREWYDNITNEIRWSPYKPLDTNQVGFLDENNPYVRTSPEAMTVTSDPEARKKLIDERMKLQKNLTLYDRFMKDVYGDTVGVLPSIRSGASRVVLGLFGDVGFGLTDTQLNQVRANQAIGNEFIKKGLFRNSERVSNLDMQNAESLSENPNRLFTDAPLVIGTVQNFQRADINRLAEIDAQLFGVPRKELDRIPMGSKSDPLPVTRGTDMILRDAFSKRPNLSMHLRFPDGKIERIDSNSPFVKQLLQGTTQ